MTADAPSRPRYRAAVALALIELGRCPCPWCPGLLAPGRFPSWRYCQACRCAWRLSEVGGRRYPVTVVSPRCSGSREEE